jgi:pimeloyl-ACP methyl ester carboxylesterase
MNLLAVANAFDLPSQISLSWLHHGLYVRECKPAGAVRGVVLFVHGATVSSSLFDLPVPGYSVLQACAQAGWWSFACDLSGYGSSERPAVMALAPQDCPLICPGDQAIGDIGRVTTELIKRTGAERITLAGGSWGSLTAARFAVENQHLLERLILIAPLYASVNEVWLNSLRNPDAATLIHPRFGGYRYVTLPDLLSRWDPELPACDSRLRRDDAVVSAMMTAELAADTGSTKADAFRVPNGTLHDLFQVFQGKALYDASRLKLPCLLVRGADDLTATAADANLLYQSLESSFKHLVTLPDAGHFMQAERGAGDLHQALIQFLNS